jgi:hypothetical protein
MITIKSLNDNILATINNNALTIDNNTFIVNGAQEILKTINQYHDIDLDYDEITYN